MGDTSGTTVTVVGNKSPEKHNIQIDSSKDEATDQNKEEISEIESISEHILEYSDNSHNETDPNYHRSPDLLKVTSEATSSFKDSPLPPISSTEDNIITNTEQTAEIDDRNSRRKVNENFERSDDADSKQSSSWPIPPYVVHISSESPINIPMELSSHSNASSKSVKEQAAEKDKGDVAEKESILLKHKEEYSHLVVEQTFNANKVKSNLSNENVETLIVSGIEAAEKSSPESDQNDERGSRVCENVDTRLKSHSDVEVIDNQISRRQVADIPEQVHYDSGKSVISAKSSLIHDESETDEQKVSARDSIESEQFPDSLSDPSRSIDDEKTKTSSKTSSTSEEIIKLDIRGQGAPKIPFIAEKIIFGPPPESDLQYDDSLDNAPAITKLLTPFILGTPEEILQESTELGESYYDSLTDNQKLEQSDRLVEELTVQDIKENVKDEEHISIQTQTKSLLPDVETGSFSTMTTDYKTICEEYYAKLVHMEEVISRRDEIIEQLTVSLQQCIQERKHLELQNKHLTNEVQNLQHNLGELSTSEHNTVQGQLSDFIKYENLIKDDSTKFYSANMSNAPCSESASPSSNGEKDMDREEMTINFSKSDPKTSEESSDDSNLEFDNKLIGLISTLDECLDENMRNDFKECLAQLLAEEVNRIRGDCETDVKEIERQFLADKQEFNVEIRRMKELLGSVKAGSADLEQFRQELNAKHEKEMEDLRTYFEKKCSDMEKNYSEDVEKSARAASSGGSASSLEAACEAALPYSSPLRAGGDYVRRTKIAGAQAHAHEIAQLELRLKQAQRTRSEQLEVLKVEHMSYVNDLQAAHKEAIASLEEQVAQLKAHIQTAENTQHQVSMYQEDIDLELEKGALTEDRLHQVRQEIIQELEEQIKVLLADPAAELTSWPLDLVALRDKIHSDATNTIRQMKISHQEELSHLRAELSGGEAEGGAGDKWRQRRNHSFDQNRQLEEVTKERDGLKRVACTLQRVVAQLVAYCAAAEDELNRTVLAELLSHVLQQQDSSFACDAGSMPTTPHLTPLMSPSAADQNSSLVSQRSRGKHVHFAPDFRGVFADMDEEALLTYLQDQDDLSLEIKNELDLSLKRLRQEAQDLLDLSSKFTGRPSSTTNTRRQLQLSEVGEEGEVRRLVERLDAQHQLHCDSCEMQKKHMEDIQAESVEREGLLRAELQAVLTRLALVSTRDDQPPAPDLIAEGYGTVQHPRTPLSLPVRTAIVTPPLLLDSRSASLDCSSGRRAQDVARLTHELDALAKERDDLLMQLEAANRQLRSTRLFVEEQTTERELERDEFARQVRDLRDENARLGQRLQQNARILNEVEQLETQAREMSIAINELEAKKSETESELKVTVEKISLLRDIIANLESQLEQKSSHETEILEKLEEMRKTIDERDSKMRGLLGELESLKSERAEQTDISCLRCSHLQEEDDAYVKLLEKVKVQARWLEDGIHRRTQQLERLHEAVSSTSCSEPSEDVSIRDQKNLNQQTKSAEEGGNGQGSLDRMAELAGVWECLEAHSRAEDAAFKRIRDLEMQRVQLKDVAQEVRAERDVLQQRMSEQALKISSLAARLELQRTHAEALAHENSSRLSVQLHDATAEVQRLTEELESKEKQLSRLKAALEESRRSSPEQRPGAFNNTGQAKDKIIILERELATAQSKLAQLEALAKTLESDKTTLLQRLREQQRQIAEREAQLQELLALKLDDENQKEQKSEHFEGGKNSARTLSDIVSISDYDEQDLQMRRAEINKPQNISITSAPYPHDNKSLNRTLPPDLNERPHLSSLNIEHTIDHLDLAHFTPTSLPTYLTSTTNKDIKNLFDLYKRNVNETTVFAIGDSMKHSTAHGLPDNCSLFPNRELNETKNVTIEPKKINFSIESSSDNKSDNVKSLEELGMNIDFNQEQFPDILTQLKHEVAMSRIELEKCRTELKQAEEQLCEFPALKEEVEELKTLLESTMATMEQDKKFYGNQLENFSITKKLLEQQLSEMSEQVNEKSNDLHLLKEDILRRENMVLELAKEKRNLVNKMTELEMKYETLQNRNELLEKFENENTELKDKLRELKKMEQLVSEKNLQIDNLNEHLNRLDNMQRCLDDKTEEIDRLKDTMQEKSNEIFQLQDRHQAITRDLSNISDENSKFDTENRELRDKLSKIEKEQDNTSFQLQTSISELEKMAACNIELSTKLEDMKMLNDNLKDKECEIEILNEDIKYFHDEIASLKEELMVSRSPSPRESKSGSGEEKGRSADKRINNDKKELVKIRKHVSLLQHELAFNKKDLNEKAFELARAKLDVTELKNNLNQASKLSSDREIALSGLTQENSGLRQQLQQLAAEKIQLTQQLEVVGSRLREEGDLRELQEKLRVKTEQCLILEQEMEALKDTIERLRESPTRTLAILPANEEQALVRSTQRSPTAELESAVRAQLSYSHQLDDSIMEQILSGGSTAARSDTDDDEEPVPRLHLDVSQSSSSVHSSTSEKLSRLKSDNEKLKMQVSNLEARLKDKEALITELNRIRDKLVQDWQSAKLKYEAEKDNSGRLQLLLDTQKETADSLQSQDLNMISILKKRLEQSMVTELDLQQSLQQERLKSGQLQRQLAEIASTNTTASPRDTAAQKLQIDNLTETNERVKGEITLLKSKLDREKTRLVDLQNHLDQKKLHFQREVETRNEQCNSLRQELAETKRLKHEAGVELLKAREAIHQLERRLSSEGQKPLRHALSEFEEHKSELSREIAGLKRSLELANAREISQQPDNTAADFQILQLKEQSMALQERLRALEQENLALRNKANGQPEDKDHAVRFLHSRCLRLESCRKALVWQKRYLQRVLHPYTELEKFLQQQQQATQSAQQRDAPAAGHRFKSAALAAVAVVRMQYLVRRRQHIRTVSADCLLRRSRDRDSLSRENTLPRPQPPYTSNSPPSRDRAAAPPPRLSTPSAPHLNQSLYLTPPLHRGNLLRAGRETLGQPRNMRQGLGERRAETESRESFRACSSPLLRGAASLCDDAASLQSSAKEQMCSADLLAHKLDSMSRLLQQAMEAQRDVP